MTRDEKTKQPRAGKRPNRPPVDRRSRKLQLFSISSTILFLLILLVFNLAFDQLLGTRLQWDWTTGKMYSLGEVSRSILKNLDQPVTITALFREEDAESYGYKSILPLLREYESSSGGQVKLRFIDPDRTPSVLREVDPTGYLAASQGDLVVTCAATGKGRRLTNADLFQTEMDYRTFQSRLVAVTAEQSISGAIQAVLSPTTPTVYFTTGHDEISYEQSMTAVTGILKNNNFAVGSLDLLSGQPVPADCAVLVLADPKKDLATPERESINHYLKTGGSLMVLSSFGTADLTNLNLLLKDYDLALSGDKIREGDTNHRLNNDPYTLRAIAPVSSVSTKAIDGYTLLDNARGIDILISGKSYIKTEPLLTTSAQGIREAMGDPTQSSAPGTQTLAALCTHEGYLDGKTVTDSTRVMVVGASSVFTDPLISQFGNNIYNPGLFYYGIQWLAGKDAAGSLYIPAKVPPNYAVLSGSSTTNSLVAVVSIVIIPLALLIAAAVVYRRRRNL